ncbi:MAG: YoaK family protein [Terriglobia bacterium]
MPRPVPAKVKGWLAIALTWNAGFVDAVGYLVLLNIYTAHMSGNSVALGISLSQLNWARVAEKGWPIVGFIGGLILCSLINTAGARRQVRSISSVTLGLEAALLGAFILLTPRLVGAGGLKAGPLVFVLFLVTLLTTAMGLQTSTLNHAGGLTLYTTFVTGTLAKFADGIAEFLTWFYDRTRGRSRHRKYLVARVSSRQKSLRESALMAELWTGYIAGAVSGALMRREWQSTALALPFILLLVLILIDQYRPIAPAAAKKPEEAPSGSATR